jgi:hypothetical protein
MRAALAIVLALAAPVAWGQVQIQTWQQLGPYIAEQTTKLNELNAKLRFQQELIDGQQKVIDEQKAALAAQKEFIAVQRDWLANLNCNWNNLLAVMAAGQPSGWNSRTAVGTPPIAYQADPTKRTRCGDPTKPAPLLPAAP